MIQLKPHPDSAATERMSVSAAVERRGWTFLFRFRLEHPPGAVIVSDLSPMPMPADELWRTTCFEAFIGGHDERYVELNFSPSGDWAAYCFDRYRDGMRTLDLRNPPKIALERTDAALILTASVRLREARARSGAALGLAAVVEHADGGLSYWALDHAAGAPDFHRSDCFVAALP